MAVLRLGVLPRFLIIISITRSVAVLNPLMNPAQRHTKKAPIGAKTLTQNASINIFPRDPNKLKTRLGNGAALIKNPYGTKLLSNWNKSVLNKYVTNRIKGIHTQTVRTNKNVRTEVKMIAIG